MVGPSDAAKARPGIVAAWAVLLALGAPAEASHGWGGSLEVSSVLGLGEPVVLVSGYLSFDANYLPSTSCGFYVVGDRIPYNRVSYGHLGISNPQTPIITVTGAETPIPFDMLVEFVDPTDHCRFAARIVQPGGEGPIPVPYPPWALLGDPLGIIWTLSARENGGGNHINNADGIFRMEALIETGVDNDAPVVNYSRITFITDHGLLGYGNHHCGQGTICNFYIPATDPDGDPVTWRLALPAEADVGGNFNQPAGLTINKNTGLATWNTNAGQPKKGGAPAVNGEVYSTQIILEDGRSQVPIDFMIEIGPPPDPCPDGTPRVVDPLTGELKPCPGVDICTMDPTLEECQPPPPPVPPCTTDPLPPECIPPPTTGNEPDWDYWPEPGSPPLPPSTVSGALQPPTRFLNVAGDGMDDGDKDQIKDHLDKCPGIFGGLNDLDGDGLGDECDPDDDNDGILDEMDACHDSAVHTCKVDDVVVSDVEARHESSRGSRELPQTLAAGDASVLMDESDSRSSTPAWVLGGVAAAMFLLVLAAARRR